MVNAEAYLALNLKPCAGHRHKSIDSNKLKARLFKR